MSETGSATKDGASGKALTKEQIVKGAQASKKTKVSKGAAVAKNHTLVEGANGRVPWYSQNPGASPPSQIASWTWANDRMNTRAPSPKRIADVGCGLTSAAMILSFFGHRVTPGELNVFAQNNQVYDPANNCISDWNKLFSYGGANLRHSRGTVANGRALADADEAKNPALRKALWEIAKRRARQGLPTLARVDYAGDSEGTHSNWGDHFLVIVGIHEDGHLLINDPGRFVPNDLHVGNGAQAPDRRHNWLAEDPANGTKKNGGYTLMRLDTVDTGGAPMTEATWKDFAKTEIVEHVNTAFVPRLLATARGVVIQAVKTRFEQVTTETTLEFEFKKDHLDLLVQQASENAIKGLHHELRNKVLSVIDEVEARVGQKVAIHMPDWLKKAIPKPPNLPDLPDGLVKRASEVIGQGAQLLDDAVMGSAIPVPPFVEKLRAAREQLPSSIKFKLLRCKLGTRNMLGLQVSADLLENLTSKPEWAQLDADGTLTFLFPNLDELAEAILVKVFTKLGLITHVSELMGLIAPDDQQRLDRIIHGSVRLEIKASASTFSPRPLLDVLKANGQARGHLVIDFEVDSSGTRAVLAADASGEGQLGGDQGTVDVSLVADGRLAIKGASFASMWDSSPTQAFDDLVSAFLATIDGRVAITMKGVGHADAEVSAAALGLFKLHGNSDLFLKIEYEDGKVAIDFGGAGAGEIEHDGHVVELALTGAANARFQFPAPHSFIDFWKDPRAKFIEIIDRVLQSFQSQASLELKARDTFRVGVLTLSPEGVLKLGWSGSQATLQVAAGCATQIEYEEHRIKLALGAAAGAQVQIPGAPTFRDFWRDPQAKFQTLLTKLLESLRAQASISVKAVDAFSVGLLEVAAEAEFFLELAPPEALFRFSGAGVGRAIDVDGKSVTLALGGGADVRFDLRRIDVAEFWDDPQGSFELLLTELPDRLLGKVKVAVTAASGVAIADIGTLDVSAGLALEFDQDDVTLKFGGTALLALAAYPTVQLGIGLNVEAGGPWERKVTGQSIKQLWANPEERLPQVLRSFMQQFEGHARLVIDTSVTVDEEFRLPQVQEQLRTWKIDSLVGGGRFVVNYWKKPSEQYVVVKFDVSSSGTTQLISGATIGVTFDGVCRVADMNLQEFLAHPTTELTKVEQKMLNTLAARLDVRFVYRELVIRANVTELYDAIQNFNRNEILDGFVCLNNSGYVTLPGEAEKRVVDLSTYELTVTIVTLFRGWVAS